MTDPAGVSLSGTGLGQRIGLSRPGLRPDARPAGGARARLSRAQVAGLLAAGAAIALVSLR